MTKLITFLSHVTISSLLLLTACGGGAHPEEDAPAEGVDLPFPHEWLAPAALQAQSTDETNLRGDPPAEIPVAAGAPKIAAWHETAHSGESLTLTGVRFTLREAGAAGSDTVVWVRSAGSDATLQASLWSVEPEVLVVSLPEQLEPGVALLWVENADGVSAPVAVNRAKPQWLGPLGNRSEPGGTKRVFGRNLAIEGAGTSPRILIRSDDRFIEVPVGEATPYSLAFTVPDLSEGPHEVWVHNGTGGVLGWGGSLTLEIGEAWERGPSELSLRPSGADDWEAVDAAVQKLGEEPNGGTLRLAAGEFRLSRMLVLPPKVRIAGAGMDATKLVIDHTRPQHSGITFADGPHAALEDLTVQVVNDAGHPPTYGIFNTQWKGENDHLRLTRIRWKAENGVASNNTVNGRNIKVSGIESWNRLAHVGTGHWLHDNTYYGQIYSRGIAGITAPRLTRSVIEQNHFETPDWPTGPDGSRNYRELIEPEKLKNETYFCKRILSAGRGTNHNFIAYNTSKDVAARGNLAEMVLFHGNDGLWFGEAASAGARDLTVEPNGRIDGEVVTLARGRLKSRPFPAEAIEPGVHSVVVTAGPGIGQARRIVSVDGPRLELDRPWRVPPTTESRIMITELIEGNVIYRNQLNAFPEGFRLDSWTASSPVSFWGNCWNNVSHGNHSRRTNAASTVWSLDGSPSYWNVFRNEVAEEVFSTGFTIVGDNEDSPAGASTLGNALRQSTLEIVGNHPGAGSDQAFLSNHASPQSGNIFESVTARGPVLLGIDTGAVAQGLYRNLTLDLEPFEGPVEDGYARSRPRHPATLLRATPQSRPLLSNVQSSGTERDWMDPTAKPLIPSLLPLHRVVRLSGDEWAGSHSLNLLLANPGIEESAIDPRLPEGMEIRDIQPAALPGTGTTRVEGTLIWNRDEAPANPILLVPGGSPEDPALQLRLSKP